MPRSGTSVLQQFRRMNAQAVSQPNHHHQTGISTTPLNAAQIGHVDLGVAGKLLLAQPAALSQLQHIAADDCPPVHPETELDNDYSHQGL